MGDDSHVLPRGCVGEPGNSFIPPGVIRIDIRVDDPQNRFIRQLSNCRDDFRRQLFGLRIDDEHALITNLYGNVGPATRQHINVSLDVNRLDLHATRIRRRCLKTK